MAPVRTLVSLHDVMPGTLGAVRAQLQLLANHGVDRATLLVVPGLDWSARSIEQLHRWQADGHELAGHGWLHRAGQVRGLRHRVHAALLSRDCAEHLALTAAEIASLLRRCHAWFGERGLLPPTLYVPPAWALGAAPRAAYAEAGFRQVEHLQGLWDLDSGTLQRIPAVGYESISAWRAVAVKASNAGNRVLARHMGWLRLGLHPRDLQLPLRGEALRDIDALRETLLYRDLLPGVDVPGYPVSRAA